MGEQPLRYDAVAIALHWLIGVALFAQITFGFALDEIAPRGTPPRSTVINLHKSFGLVLGVAIVARLAWRVRHRAPPWPATMPSWQQRAATWSHCALYACMLLMPASGYVASNFSKYGVRFFGLLLPPWGPDVPLVWKVFSSVHMATAWAFSVLILGHVIVAIKHALVDHALFARMRPRVRL